jgi:hypothetical protein
VFKKKAFVVSILLIGFLLHPLYGQIKQTHIIVISFLQLKDDFNLGMVFNGVQPEYRYGISWKIGESELLYQPKIAFGAAFSRGMTGYQINFAPVNVSWVIPFYNRDGHTLKAGTNFAANYSYQMYPDLHSGHLFRSGEIGLSPRFEYQYQWNQKRIAVSAQNSLLGFVSHTQKNDPYFYSFNASDFFIRPHEDMKFGSFNNYDHTVISVEFAPDIRKIHSFLWELDYFGSFYGTQFQRLNHSLIWKISI